MLRPFQNSTLKIVVLIATMIYLGTISLQLKAQNPDLAFKKAIRYADSVYSTGDYKSARAAYLFAQRLNPSHPGVGKRLNEIDEILAQTAKTRTLALQSLFSAQTALNNNNLEKAEEALIYLQKLNSQEKDILQQYNDLRLLYNQKLEVRKAFDTHIHEAEKSLSSGFYDRASTHATAALELKPQDEKALQLQSEIKYQKQLAITKFDPLYASAQFAFNKRDYTEALSIINEALKILPEHRGAQEFYNTCAEILAYQQELAKMYSTIIQRADKAYAQGNTSEAIQLYRQALDVNPDEEYPKTQIRNIELAATDAKAKLDQYKNFVAMGDAAFNAAQWEQAALSYAQALTLKPGDKYAAAKKKDADLRWANEKRLENNFRLLISQGDSLAESGQWELAINAFTKASQLKPYESYPKERLAYLNNNLRILKENQKKFDEHLLLAQQNFKKSRYDLAHHNIKDALAIFPDEPRALNLLNRIKQSEKEQETLYARYASFIHAGDSLMALKEWQMAINSYSEALLFVKDDNYARQKIAEAKGFLSQKEEYASGLINAEQLLQAGRLEEAKKAFSQLSKKFPGDPHLRQKQLFIDSLLTIRQKREALFTRLTKSGDSLLKIDLPGEALKKYHQAYELNTENPEITTKIANAQQKLQEKASEEARIEAWMAEAQQNFLNAKYVDASVFYRKVLALRPNHTEALKQLTLSDSLNKVVLAFKEKTTQLKLTAERLYGERKWHESMDYYQRLLELDPNDDQTRARIVSCQSEIENEIRSNNRFNQWVKSGDSLSERQLFAEAIDKFKQALQIRPGDEVLKQKLMRLERQLNEWLRKEEKFAQLIREGDSLELKGIWFDARKRFEQALQIKPTEIYPKEKIRLLSQTIKEIEAKEEAYTLSMQKGESAFAKGQWDKALEYYEEALLSKPGDDKALYSLERVKVKMKEREALDRKFALLISQADSILNTGALNEALLILRQASALKPNEVYPLQRISEIERQIHDRVFLETSYSRAVSTGDSCFDVRLYNDALKAFMKASHFKPEEAYPREKIRMINELLTSPRAVEGITYEKALEAARNEEKAGRLGLAFDSYLIALHLEPHRTEAAEGLHRTLFEALNDTLALLETSNLNLIAGIGKLYELPTKAKTSRALLVITLAEEPKEDAKIIVNYGRGGTTTGGIVVRILKNPATHTYMGQLGGQSGWDEDIRWIKFMPEPGNLKVNSIIISGK